MPIGMVLMSVTLQDLARLAGANPSTVSRVLSGKPGVSERRRKAILRLAEEVGYQPNRMAQSMALGRSRTLGVVVSTLNNPVYVELFQLITASQRYADYQIMIADSRKDLAIEKRNIANMLQHQVEGMIVFPVADWMPCDDVGHLLQLRERRVPFVLVGEVEGHGFDSVTSDEMAAAHEIVEHLAGLGHRSFAIVGLDEGNRVVSRRYDGIVVALRELRLLGRNPKGEPPLPCVMMNEPDWIGRTLALFGWPQPPTALIVMNSITALQLYRPLLTSGIAMPGDVSLVCFEDQIWAEHLSPSLSSSGVDYRELAGQAYEALVNRTEHPKAVAKTRLVARRLVARESSGPVPGACGKDAEKAHE